MLMLALMDLLAGNKPLADTLVVTVLPALAAALSGWLSHDGWKDWVNGLITGVVVLLLSAGYALLAGKMVSDWLTDAAIISGIVTAFLAGPLKPIYDTFLVKTPSLLAIIIGLFFHSFSEYVPEPAPAPTVLRASRPSSSPALPDTLHSTSPLPAEQKSQDPPSPA